MTPGMIALTIALGALAIVGLAWLITAQIISYDSDGRWIGGIIGAVLLILGASTVWIPHWWLHHTAGGERSLRNYHLTRQVTQHRGPLRTARIYSATGQLIATYSGRFDVGHNSGFIDLDIYQPNGSVKRVLIDDTMASMTVEDQ